MQERVEPMDYKTAGVDIEAGNAFAKSIPIANHGFGGMFPVPSGYEKPVLVSGADGVGTKINIARIAGDYTTIGIDLVAMCVNDVITSGAKPLYFLDYVSTKKIDDNVADIMVGILKGCEIAGIDLIGGETAEHFRQNEYDLAGFCTGIVEQAELIDGRLIKPGDKIIGLSSSGLHSNGYTIVNDGLWRHHLMYKDQPELLTPTTIYAPLVADLLEEYPIVGMAHITGGGLVENVPRILPEGLKAEIDYDSWERPEIFNIIQNNCDVAEEEMRRVFNLGIGYCLIVPPDVTIDTGKVIGEVTE
jgi:phosphoribosylformylglycinamidine cyclo-ligase